SLRPSLYAEAIDPDNWPGTGLRYLFKICRNLDGMTGCTESGWTNATWTPPPGTLRWSHTYYWWALTLHRFHGQVLAC
ncbi:MAG TPA: hypothetical protein VHH53_01890, partial [Pseudonocardiaceae bacterium]|nr:hypothetical protein [Pseudonocardiaceae bacterium]